MNDRPPVEPLALSIPQPANLPCSNEDLLTLAAAARRLPRIDGRKIAIPTIWRWCRKGLRGVHLEYVRVGRKICTTHEALLRFFSALSALDKQTLPPGRPSFLAGRKPVTAKQRLRALAEADAVLKRARI